MTLELGVVPKRTRESTSKVRTGCSTCKARRVKCDESKPVCQRCVVGNRNCKYITAQATPPSRNVVTIYLPPMYSQPVLFDNDHGLAFFHQNLAAKLDGHFDSKFWSQLVLQLSRSEPSIRHAVSAISVIYQDVESSLQDPAGYVKANPKAQQEWHKAMNKLSARIQTHPDSSLVPLVCCLLFTCIEFLKGNVETSMLHVQNGFNILTAIRGSGDVTTNKASKLSFNDFQAIEDHIVPIFSRLNVLCSLADKVTPPIHASVAKECSPQEDLTDSRRRLFEISDKCVRFIQGSGPKAALFQIDIDDLVEQAKLRTTLDTWHDQLEDLVGRLQSAGIPVNLNAVHLLQIQYKVMFIWIRVCTTAEESATDSYHTEFEELVQYAEAIAKSGLSTAVLQPLSFELQVVGPLYYTALKCRHPNIRRRALRMLRLAPRREGLWNAHHAYVTAQRVIELEERHVNRQDFPVEASRLHNLPLPGDESRIYNVGEMPFDFRKFDQTVVTSPTCPGTLEAVFQIKPWGLLGDWQAITEYIEL